MSASAATVTTASITPDFFSGAGARSLGRAVVIPVLALLLLAGLAFRAAGLGAEGLSEDELNKLRAVGDYRARGLTSANGEHPMLMKGLLTASVVACEAWNGTALAQGNSSLRVSEETALRLPGVLLGSFSSLLLFLLVSELFGTTTGLIAAALWALDPAAVGFNRIAKEDTFYLFFFLLANVFWLRGQRAAESGRGRPEGYYWAAAAAFGAMMAAKYLPHMFAVSASYYWIFQGVPATRWRLGKKKYLVFFAIMGLAFLACNPTILLPGTWHEMRVFAGERRIGHDAYEFMGRLYPNQMTLWLNGSPWYFYYAFILFKLPLTVVAFALVGLPLLFTRRLGDGRYFILFWLFFWFFPFTLLGGKFTRYFTLGLPAVLITAAIGLQASMRWLAGALKRAGADAAASAYAQTGLALLALSASAAAAAGAVPHYRLYTNALGGGPERAGSLFPHDEFYDASVRETAARVATLARPGARVASETPELFTHYARQAGRADLTSASLSDPRQMRAFGAGDLVVVARGRRYFSNDALVRRLEAAGAPAATLTLGRVHSTSVFVLDETSAAAIAGLPGRAGSALATRGEWAGIAGQTRPRVDNERP